MVDALHLSRLQHWCVDAPQLAAVVLGRAGGRELLCLQRDSRTMLRLRQPALRLSHMSCCLQAQSILQSHAGAVLRMPAGSAASKDWSNQQYCPADTRVQYQARIRQMQVCCNSGILVLGPSRPLVIVGTLLASLLQASATEVTWSRPCWRCSSAPCWRARRCSAVCELPPTCRERIASVSPQSQHEGMHLVSHAAEGGGASTTYSCQGKLSPVLTLDT